jgi:thiamine-phosphate pyrophosphorylase
VKLLVLTDRHQSARAGRGLATTIGLAVAAGAPAVLFREKDLPGDERRALGERVAEACKGAELVVASDPTLARDLGARAVHLAASDPWIPGHDLAIGRSCHSATELADAADHRADYATVSPVFATASKPDYGPALGLEGLRALTETSALPIIALGGIGPGEVTACLAAGAAGIAVMGAVMAADDPGTVITDLLDQGALA